MAVITKKDKLLEEAQKLVQRGQFDKAATCYEQILAQEPAAINLRQKLAELLIKSGRSDDARTELEIIGKNFTKNGFYLKAIAVYKQLQKLFPTDISLSLTLAELNEKHGLIANALSEYKSVYDYYEKAGNTPEALTILDRMQNVDPLNVPIKLKLAESYAQQGKKEESYATFSRTAALLLERLDNAAFSGICARVTRLFPDKPDFMLEVLSEQIRQGNAATTIDSIQGLLRGNPNNKRAWDLIVLAYQRLGQPQKVKVAYQHYLNFFPSEPAAMFGVISSAAADKNLAGAVQLLDRYEAALISAGFLHQLEQLYRSLDAIDPINGRVLEGQIRVAAATGNAGEVQSLTSKLHSLRAMNGAPPDRAIGAEAPQEFPSEPPSLEPPETGGPALPPAAAEPEATSAMNAGAPGATDQPDEEIEIDLEIDLDSPFGKAAEEADAGPAHDNWLDSVGSMFDTISTAPRGVKFGNEMESSDAQSHFDLGQAFKEMGLYDEALNEFREASRDASRRLECLIMQCACLRERGEQEKSISMLRALLNPELSPEESCAVKYELALGYEAVGNTEEAHLLLGEINTVNPGFRDINARLNPANTVPSLDFSDEDLLDF